MNILEKIPRNEKGQFIKGYRPLTGYKKGHIPWSKGRKIWTGDKNPKWKGGSFVQNGYKLIMQKEHPQAIKGYVFEHRLIMEKSLGRFLSKDEIVHHINENLLDNRIENLELITRARHASLHLSGRKIRKKTKDKISESLKNWYKTENGRIKIEETKERMRKYHKARKGL